MPAAIRWCYLEMARVAITGGSGYIGSALGEALIGQFDVRILDTKISRLREAEFVQCDIRNYAEVEKGVSDVDLVIHAAIVQIPQINENKRLGYEVNILGTHNVCEAVQNSQRCKGLLLVSTWHTMGEIGITGVVDERFGLRPDMVEERARAYSLSKMGQEAIVRLHDESSREKIYGVVRIGTTLGEGMPEKTAANIFINKAIKGEALTPYEHSMYRPMLYVDVGDVCRAFKSYASKILEKKIVPAGNSLEHIANVYHPDAITILELAQFVRQAVENCSDGKIVPTINVVRTGEPMLFTSGSKKLIKIDINKSKELLEMGTLTDPRETIARIVRNRMTAKPASSSLIGSSAEPG